MENDQSGSSEPPRKMAATVGSHDIPDQEEKESPHRFQRVSTYSNPFNRNAERYGSDDVLTYLLSKGKSFVFTMGIIAQCNSTLASSLTAGASTEIGAFFGVTNTLQLALPMSCYLIGNVLGPVLWSPLSETSTGH